MPDCDRRRRHDGRPRAHLGRPARARAGLRRRAHRRRGGGDGAPLASADAPVVVRYATIEGARAGAAGASLYLAGGDDVLEVVGEGPPRRGSPAHWPSSPVAPAPCRSSPATCAASGRSARGRVGPRPLLFGRSSTPGARRRRTPALRPAARLRRGRLRTAAAQALGGFAAARFPESPPDRRRASTRSSTRSRCRSGRASTRSRRPAAPCARVPDDVRFLRWHEWAPRCRPSTPRRPRLDRGAPRLADSRGRGGRSGAACSAAGERAPRSVIVGVGIDLVEVERVRDLVARRGAAVLTRLFTPEEARTPRSPRPRARLAARLAQGGAYKALSATTSRAGSAGASSRWSLGCRARPRAAVPRRRGAAAAELGVDAAWLTLTTSAPPPRRWWCSRPRGRRPARRLGPAPRPGRVAARAAAVACHLDHLAPARPGAPRA
jgi:phosphopantetheinyl transferase (holo-ACP synthase)